TAETQALTRTFRAGSSSNLSRSTRLNVAQFLQKLYEMVNDPNNNDLIRWSDGGDSFVVLDHERFAREVLGRWFKHQNFQSFVRQLNMYGFHKIPSLQQGVLRSESDTEVWNFEHVHFRQGQPDLLCLISRKKQTNQPTPGIEDGHVEASDPTQTAAGQTSSNGGTVFDINSIVNGIAAIKRHQQTISADLNELKNSNQALWQEALAARERHSKQQDMINRILKFLGSVFGRNDGHDSKDHEVDTPTPQMVTRRGQRLMIGGGEHKHKGVEVVEVDDDDNRSTPSTSHSDDTGPFATTETPAPGSPTASRASSHINAFSPTLSTANGYYPDPSLTLPDSPWMQALSVPPPPPPEKDGSAVELHRPQSTQPPLVFNQNTPQDIVLQAALQQLAQSPALQHRFIQALSTSAPPNPDPPAAASTSIQSYQPLPNPQPFPQIAPFGVPNTYDLLDPTQAQAYKDQEEINADVDALHASINSLIENMGLNPNLLQDPDPAMHPAVNVPAPDFDFDAFLTQFTQGGGVGDGGGEVNLGDVTGADASASAMDQRGISAFMDEVAEEQPLAKAQAQAQAAVATTGRKRRSDVADLDLPSVTPTSAPSPASRLKKSKN
ncbi:hypothetical protein OF83DRAFT_1147139, partial [Amylostereum chailletii]